VGDEEESMSSTRGPREPSIEAVRTPDLRGSLQLSGVLLTAGFLVYLGVSVVHPAGVDPNDHPAVFATYARSMAWTAVHLGQFAGFAGMVAGLCVLIWALTPRGGAGAPLGAIGLLFATAALALTAGRYAVDGVALKRAVDAWAAAPRSEKTARLASAEAIRWVEEAMTSYQGIVLAVTLLCAAALIVRTRRAPLGVGYVLAVSAVAFLVVGWIVGVAGFASPGTIPGFVSQACLPVAGVWLMVGARRMPAPAGG
jgi:hypothetical protein